MNQDQARRLVDETLGNDFNQAKFVEFARELLRDGLETGGNFSPLRTNVQGDFRYKHHERIESYEKIGSFVGSLDVLIVKLHRAVTLQRGRTTLREFAADYLIKGQGLGKTSVLAAFYSEGDDTWRFSYVKADVTLITDENGKVKEAYQKSEAKRFSFLVGRNERTHTARKQFIPLLTSADALTIAEIERAFSIEIVTEEFFSNYKVVFDRVEDELKQSIPNTKQNDKEAEEKRRLYTQRLFNRLMFIYFLQKKGWLSFDGNKNYLRRLFTEAETNNENFLNDRLFWLFFSGLGYSENPDLHNSKLMQERRGNVEYLNGGLFEKDIDGFDARGKIKIDNRFFGEVLELFELYNFTVDESTPTDIEIAVDPEMLGKVFEELVTGRHDTGSYYTPRQIVSFMCRESLKNYLAPHEEPEIIAEFVDKGSGENLKNPERILKELKRITVCDPACGSGAYLLGMMQELLRLRQAVFASKKIGNEKIYDDKLEIIENNIYGVDKDQFAVQIASLRLWLSLSIDSDKPKPLPNLKYKIGCGDALLAPLEKDSNLFRKPLIKEFKEQKAKHVRANKPEQKDEKKQIEERIKTLRVEIAQSLHHLPEPPKPEKIRLAENNIQPLEAKIRRCISNADKYQAEKFQRELNALKSQIQQWSQELNNNEYKPNFFDWAVEFAEIFADGGFDVILANPPYVQLQKDGGRLAKLYQNKNFETFARTGDIYSLFYERGFELLKEKGVLSFITSNKWMRANYGERTRKFFAEKTKPLIIIDFGSVKIFGTATVDNNILLLQKAEREAGDGITAVRTETDFDISQSLSTYIEQNSYQLSSVNENSWVIGEKDEFDIKVKVEKQGVALEHESWNIHINYGVKTGFNEAYVIPGKVKDKILRRAKENKSDRSAEILKRVLRGKDIKAWFPEFADFWLINSHNGVKAAGLDKIEVEKDYPAIYEHLKQYEENLIKRQDKGDHWTNLRNCAYINEFELPKIIYPNMTKYLPFIYDETGFYTNDKNYIITGKSLKYLTSFFNSKLFKYCFSNNFPNLGEDRRELRKVFFDKIPVKQISNDDEKPFNAIVDYVTFLKQQIQKLKSRNGEYKNELAMSLFFEQLSDALILETYLQDDFRKADISIKKHLPEFTEIPKKDGEKSLQIIYNLYQKIEHFTHPVRANISAMKSIPAIQVIYNTVRF